jgi:hypothetical protein
MEHERMLRAPGCHESHGYAPQVLETEPVCGMAIKLQEKGGLSLSVRGTLRIAEKNKVQL